MKSSPITRRRGDTYRIRIPITDETILPLAGTFLLVVTEQTAPISTDTPVMELVGSIVGAAADGILDFPLTTNDADQTGQYFYEVENTLGSGEIRTIREGPFTMIQDRAKADETFEWTPPIAPADGDPVMVNGSEHWWCGQPTVSTHIYETRDSRRVIKVNDFSNIQYWSLWRPTGPDFPRKVFTLPGWEWRVTVFLDETFMRVGFTDGFGGAFVYLMLNAATKTPTPSGDFRIQDPSSGNLEDPFVVPLPDASSWPVTGWFQFGFRINPVDSVLEYMIKEEGTSDNWYSTTPWRWPVGCSPILNPYLYSQRVTGSGYNNIWKYQWRRLAT